MDELKALILDDEKDMLEVCRDSLRSLPGIHVRTECESRRALELLASEAFDVLVLDLRIPDIDGLEMLRRATREQPEIEVIVITGFPSIETAVQAIKLGASDYIVKPFTPEELCEKVERAIDRKRARAKGFAGRDLARDSFFEGCIGKSPAMQRVFKTIEQVAPTDSDVLILGESGTGKELIARSIHSRSGRKGRFVPVDCGAIPENLLESEFFGHRKGAFTGAREGRIGLLEFAQGGTFFMDEVCELAPNLQAKLLRALQERSFRPVGSDREIQVDVRVVAATNRDIEQRIREGQFREDLYYRINVVKLRIPPLQERRDDIPLLITHFLGRFAREMGKALLGVEEGAMQSLLSYSWPGNVRELQNVLRRAVTMTEGEWISLADLAGDTRAARPGDEDPGFFPLRSGRMQAFEREYLVKLLTDVQGDVQRASELASLPRSTLYRLLKKYKIRPGDYR